MKLEAKGGGLEKADKKNIYTLLGLSIVIVLLSAINFINLKTAQASQRAKEVEYAVMGGTTWQLTSQFYSRHYSYVCLLICWQTALAEILLPAYNKFWVKKLHYLMLVFCLLIWYASYYNSNFRTYSGCLSG